METTTKQESVMQLELEPAEQHPAPAHVQQHQLQHATPTPMDMIAAAVNRGASIAEIGQLMDLKDRLEASEARKAFVAAMAAFKRSPPTILKNKLADFRTEKGRTTYTYSDLANVCEVIIGALATQGISHDWSPAQNGNSVTVTCTLTHELGHTKSATLTAMADKTGGKNDIQAIGSAVSYLERYTLLAACGIAVGDGSDDDGNGTGDGGEPLNKNAVREAAAESRQRNAKPADVAAAKNGSAKQSEPSAALVKLARDAADQGVAKFGQFWKAATQKERDQLRPEMADLEQRYKNATPKE